MNTNTLRLRSAVAALAGTLAAGSLGALSIVEIAPPPPPIYSPDSIEASRGSFRVKSEGYKGDFYIVLRKLSGSGSQPGAQPPAFSLYKPAGDPTYALSLDGSPAGPDEILSGNFGPRSGYSSVVELDYAILVSRQPLPPAASYSTRIEAQLYRGSFNSKKEAGEPEDFTVEIIVGQHCSVSILPTEPSSPSEPTLDFGTIFEGALRNAEIVVRSNVRYDLSIRSTRGGKLAQLDKPTSTIAYELAVDSLPIRLRLDRPSYIAWRAPPTYGTPRSYSLGVEILPFATLPEEGNYADSLTLTVSAR